MFFIVENVIDLFESLESVQNNIIDTENGFLIKNELFQLSDNQLKYRQKIQTMKESLINMRNFLASRGYDVWPLKMQNGRFKALLFKNDTLHREGEKEYVKWQECIEETEEKFYFHINKNN